jgi:hypothetical protein
MVLALCDDKVVVRDCLDTICAGYTDSFNPSRVDIHH